MKSVRFAEVVFEQFGQALVRSGRWKLMRMPPPHGTGDWQLFDTIADPGERNDLSAVHPDIRSHLLAAYDEYASEHGLNSAPASIDD